MSEVKTVIVKQVSANPVRTIVVTQADNPIKKIVINRGLQGDVGPEGPVGPMGPATNLVTETILLSSLDVASKSFTLSSEPLDPTQIELTPIGGILQVYGIDYVYSNGSINWSGLGLEGYLEQNEQVIVRYLKEAD
jgi:hypothetical protein